MHSQDVPIDPQLSAWRNTNEVPAVETEHALQTNEAATPTDVASHNVPIDPQLLTSTATVMMPAVETAHTVQTNEPATPTDESAQPSGSQRSRYTCPLCKKTMSRRYTVKDHFPACAEKLGNPDNLEWTNDSSTKKYIPRAQSLYNRDRAAWLEQNGDATGQTERPKKRQRTKRTLTAEEQGVVGQRETSEQSIQPTVQWQPAPNDAGNSTTATPPMIVQLSTGWYQLVPLFQPGVFNVNYTAPGAGPQPARVIDPQLVQSNEPPFAPDASWDGYWPHWPYMG